MQNELCRRELLGGLVAGAAVSRLAVPPAASADAPALPPARICVFSKHFQWTDVSEMCAIAKELGFDGIDLTVRKGGHVPAENGMDGKALPGRSFEKAKLVIGDQLFSLGTRTWALDGTATLFRFRTDQAQVFGLEFA